MSGTAAEDRADPPGLPLSPLRAYLNGRLIGLDAGLPMEVSLLGGGRSNVSYRIEQSDAAWVVRRPPLGHVLPSAHDMGREYRVLSRLAAAGVPVPRVYLYCADEQIIGAPFLVMEYVSGLVFACPADTAAMPPDDASLLSSRLVQALADLHRIDIATAGLAELGRPIGYLARQVRRWTGQWELTRSGDLNSARRLARLLAGRVGRLPPSPRAAVLHGDYRLDNLIIGPRDLAIRAILDWEMSTLGDPLADLALLLVYWSRPGDGLRRQVPVAAGVTDRPGFWSREQLIQRYQEHSGLSTDNLDFYVALACFKLAVILESIHTRHLQGRQIGVAVGEDHQLARAVPALMELGLRVAQASDATALSW
ncbi:MAG: phosphotransferase family protein [Streptosporangiaceae bacterium]